MLLRSCCCCGLRDGALAVGIVHLTLSVLQLLGVLIGWGAADAQGAYFYNRRDRNEHWRYDWSEYHVPYAEILAPCTIFVLVQLVFDVLLLRGISLSSTRAVSARGYVVAWMIFRAALFAIISIGTIGVLTFAIILRYSGSEISSVALGGLFVLTVVTGGFLWYSWVAVLSFYWNLRATETGVTYNRIQLEGTPLETRQGARQPATSGEAPAPEMAGAGQSSGQKWA